VSLAKKSAIRLEEKDITYGTKLTAEELGRSVNLYRVWEKTI
jgi:hypothetical protein